MVVVVPDVVMADVVGTTSKVVPDVTFAVPDSVGIGEVLRVFMVAKSNGSFMLTVVKSKGPSVLAFAKSNGMTAVMTARLR